MTFSALPDITYAFFHPKSHKVVTYVYVILPTMVAIAIFVYQHTQVPKELAEAIGGQSQQFLSKPTPDEIEMEDQIRSDEDTIKYMQGQNAQMSADIRTLTVTQAQQEIRLEAIEKNTTAAAQNSSSVPTMLNLLWIFGLPSLGLNAFSGIYFYRNSRRKRIEDEE